MSSIWLKSSSYTENLWQQLCRQKMAHSLVIFACCWVLWKCGMCLLPPRSFLCSGEMVKESKITNITWLSSSVCYIRRFFCIDWNIFWHVSARGENCKDSTIAHTFVIHCNPAGFLRFGFNLKSCEARASMNVQRCAASFDKPRMRSLFSKPHIIGQWRQQWDRHLWLAQGQVCSVS